MIPQYEPLITPELADTVHAQIMSGYIGSGNRITEFEHYFKFYTGSKYAIATTSGTAALMVALWSVGIREHDEVIIGDYSFPAAMNVVRLMGAYPVLVDINPHTLCMDPYLVKSKITPKTKAIIFVNHNGYIGDDVYEVREICNHYDIPMIEDAACGIGMRYGKVHCGTVGDIGTFSFSVPKLITTGQGGMLVTENSVLEQRTREIVDQGSTTWRKDGIHTHPGSNFKFNDILASYGIHQLDNIGDLLAKRESIYNWYMENGVKIFHANPEKSGGPWMMMHMCDNPEELMERLKSQNIHSKMYYRPSHQSLPGCKDSDFPVAVNTWKRALYLPSSLTLKEEDVKKICQIIY